MSFPTTFPGITVITKLYLVGISILLPFPEFTFSTELYGRILVGSTERPAANARCHFDCLGKTAGAVYTNKSGQYTFRVSGDGPSECRVRITFEKSESSWASVRAFASRTRANFKIERFRDGWILVRR